MLRMTLTLLMFGLAVDVFHFENKHADSDEFCRENCDPKKFPELRGKDGKAWYFNTSIAEQTNVWLGGFHSICREMSVDKYKFFLNEISLRRYIYISILGFSPLYMINVYGTNPTTQKTE